MTSALKLTSASGSSSRILFNADRFSQVPFQSNENLGAVEIATLLGMTLYGLSLSQVYTFFRRSRGDMALLKVFVLALLFMETFHPFVAGQAVYYETVTSWTRAQPNSYPLSVTVLTENIITFMVQCFFCYRIHILSSEWTISGTCFTLTVLRFAGGLALTTEAFLDVPRIPNGAFVARFSWLITLALSVGAGADLLIAAAMSYYLRRFASPSNLKSTTAIINRLVRWSLQTGLITSLASVTVIISFQAMSNMVWFALYIPLAKLYSISLLVSRVHDRVILWDSRTMMLTIHLSLNARPRGTRKSTAQAGGDVEMSDLQFETVHVSLHTGAFDSGTIVDAE